MDRSEFSRWVDALWGYDVFIAHRRADASGYARALHDRLAQERIAVFIDQLVYVPGDHLTVATRRHASKSSVFVLVGSPELLQIRRPVDWVQQEIEAYLARHPRDPKLILVDVGGVVDAALAASPAIPEGVLGQVSTFIRMSEPPDGLQAPPSERVVDAIRANLQGRRRDRLRVNILGATAALLLVLLGVSSWATVVARTQTAQAQRNLERVLEMNARRIAAQAAQQLDVKRPDLALMLATAALRGPPLSSSNPTPPAYLPDAALVLARASARRPVLDQSFPYARPVEVLAPSPDGALLLALTDQGQADLRRASDGRPLAPAWAAHQALPHSAAFSPDGRRFATAADDGTVIVWETASRSEVRRYRTGSAAWSVIFSPDGRTLLAGSNDGSIRHWRLADPSPDPIDTWRCPAARVSDVMTGALALAFDHGGQRLAVGCGSGHVQVWRPGSTRPERTWSVGSRVTAVAFAPDGRHMAVGKATGGMAWIDLSGKAFPRTFAGHDARIRSLDFSGDGRLLLSASDDRTASTWNTTTFLRVDDLVGHTFGLVAARFLPDGRGIVTAGDRSVRFWKVRDEDQAWTTGDDAIWPIDEDADTATVDLRSAAVDADGRRIATGNWVPGVRIVDAATGRTTARLSTDWPVAALAFGPDGQWIVGAMLSDDMDRRRLVRWDALTGRELAGQAASDAGINGLAVSPDGRSLVVADDEGAHVLDAASLASLWEPTGDVVDKVAFAGTHFATRSDHDRIQVWDAASRRPLADFRVAGKDVECLAIDPAGDVVLVGDDDGTALLFAANGRAAPRRLPRQSSAITSCAFGADGRTLATATADGTAILWETSTLRPAGSTQLANVRTRGSQDRSIGHVLALPNGAGFVLGAADSSLVLWRPRSRTYDQFMGSTTAGRRLTSEQRAAFGIE